MKEITVLHAAQKIYTKAFQSAIARYRHLSENERKTAAHRFAWIEVGRLYLHLRRVSNYITIENIEMPAVRIKVRG